MKVKLIIENMLKHYIKMKNEYEKWLNETDIRAYDDFSLIKYEGKIETLNEVLENIELSEKGWNFNFKEDK